MTSNFYSFAKKYKLSAISLFLFFILWEIASRLNIIEPLFISSPSKIFSAGYGLIKAGEILPHLAVSLEALISGFMLAVLFGVIAGLLIGSNKILYKIFSPYVFALSSLPTIAIIPLVIIWFGIGIYAKIAVVFLMALKPILINTIDGVSGVDRNLLKMARSFGADSFFVLKSVTFFSILPFVFSAMRIAVGRGITGLVMAEAFGYGKGLGYLVSFYGVTFQTAYLMFIILVLLSINMFAIRIIFLAEKNIFKWKN